VPRILSHLEEAESGSRSTRGSAEPVTVPDDPDQ
jgi:hypothetical protein